MSKKQQVLHIHGGSAFNTYEQYIDSLKKWSLKINDTQRLQRWSRNYNKFLDLNSYEIIVPEMPSKYNARYLEWNIWFEKTFEYLEGEIILVGHSLGGLFLAKYLSENILPVSIKQLHLVAAVYDYEDEIEQLGDFRLGNFPGKLLEQNIPEIHMYHSTDDTIVPIEDSQKYHNKLPGSHLHIFDDRFHFLDDTFPELFENIRKSK